MFELLYDITTRARAKMRNEVMHVCFIAECAEPSVITLDGKQWCKLHSRKQNPLAS